MFASARGLSPNVKAIRQWALLRLGRWDELLAAGRELVKVAEPLGDRWIVGHAAAPMALVLTRRGATDEAAELARTSSSELTKQFFSVPPIVAHRARGELADAERLVEGAVQIWVSEGSVPAFSFDLCDLARETVALGRPDLLDALLALAAGVQGAGLHNKTAWLAIDGGGRRASRRGARALPRRRAGLAGVRRPLRASALPPRSGPLSHRSRACERGRATAERGPRSLRRTGCSPSARRDRHAPPTRNRAGRLAVSYSGHGAADITASAYSASRSSSWPRMCARNGKSWGPT